MNIAVVSIKLKELKQRYEYCLQENAIVEKRLNEIIHDCGLKTTKQDISENERLEARSEYIEAKEQLLYLMGETSAMKGFISDIEKIIS